MTKVQVQVFALAFMLAAIGAGVGARADGDAPDMTLKDIADYKQWMRVNQAPLSVAEASFVG